MDLFRSVKSFFHALSLPQSECEIYCREKRLERYMRYGGHVSHLWMHSLGNRIVVPLTGVKMKLTGRRLHVLRDDRRQTDNPIIFCPTHIGGVDVEMTFLAVKDPCWLVFGNPHGLYKQINGMMVQMNGLIPFDLQQKSDRVAAKAQMRAVLEKGGNLLMFPEGIQNISPNSLVGYLYAGAVDLAIACGAEIVPIAIGRDKEEYYIILGENISYKGCSYDDRFKLTDELRNRMASLKWEIIEQLPSLKRDAISDTTYDDYVKNITTFDTDYILTIEDICAAQFRPKNLIAPEEAFAHLRTMIPNRKNAFLYAKYLTGFNV